MGITMIDGGRGGSFKEGDEVAICGSGFDPGPQYLQRVARITKRFVELADGSRWTSMGTSYPRTYGYQNRSIVHATEDVKARLEQKRLRGVIRAWCHARLEIAPNETLRQLAHVLLQEGEITEKGDVSGRGTKAKE